MTKKKQRFTIEVDDENFVQILDNNVQIGQYNVCKLLNELVKENEQLRKENQELHKLNQEYIDSLSDEKKETLSEMLNAILGDDGE